MEVLIEVTQGDIDEGTPRECNTCPIARAMNRKLMPHYFAAVGTEFWVYDDRKEMCTEFSHEHNGPIPALAMDFVDCFDSKREVKPITFTVDIPERYVA